MCILFIAVNEHERYPLIVAANRDEFFERPTQQSECWHDQPSIIAGRDLQAGGTWMGINKNGRLSALTNVRDPHRIDPDARTRGELVSDFLVNHETNSEYLMRLKRGKEQYNGYNLLFGDWHNLWVYNNHQDKVEQLGDGVFGLSNADLNSPWPKINKGVSNLRDYCQLNQEIDEDILFALLRDDTQANDEILPKTGVPIEWERKLSSIFIKSEEYGTRSSTLLTIDRKNTLHWQERSFDNQGNVFATKNYKINME